MNYRIYLVLNFKGYLKINKIKFNVLWNIMKINNKIKLKNKEHRWNLK